MLCVHAMQEIVQLLANGRNIQFSYIVVFYGLEINCVYTVYLFYCDVTMTFLFLKNVHYKKPQQNFNYRGSV